MNKKALLVFGIGLVLAYVVFTILRKDAPRLRSITGQTMGTIVYNVKFMGTGAEIAKEEIDDLLIAFNQSLSTYIPDSEITRLNDSGQLTYSSEFFFPILSKTQELFKVTKGRFDPTVGPLIRAWGFGPDLEVTTLDSAAVDSLLSVVGFEAVRFDEQTVSLPFQYELDFSAIAKGYAVDMVGELLENKGIDNYLVEIGGEVRCRGKNHEEKSWSLGIEDPTVSLNEQKLLAVVRLKDNSLATSGNYRNYYEKEGRIYAHIIDPRTGYTANHNLLSASVFAPDCMTADAYATAFMVMGLEEAIAIVENQKIESILVYQDEAGEIKSYVSQGIRSFVELNKAQ